MLRTPPAHDLHAKLSTSSESIEDLRQPYLIIETKRDFIYNLISYVIHVEIIIESDNEILKLNFKKLNNNIICNNNKIETYKVIIILY